VSILVPENSQAALTAQQEMVKFQNIVGLASAIYVQRHASDRRANPSMCAAESLVESATFWKVVENWQAEEKAAAKPLVTP
jgi:hypothetical protein